MADDLRMALTNLLRKADMSEDVDFLRDGVRILGQTLMDLEVSQHLRAEKNERTPERAVIADQRRPIISALGTDKDTVHRWRKKGKAIAAEMGENTPPRFSYYELAKTGSFRFLLSQFSMSHQWDVVRQ